MSPPKLVIITLFILVCLVSADSDAGFKRLKALTQRSLNATNRILNFTADDFSYFEDDSENT